MSLQIMKKAMVGAIGAAALMGAASAQAFTTVEYQNGSSTYVTGTSASDRDFSGATTLVATVPIFGDISVDCTLNLTGDVSVSGGQAFIDVTSGSVSGSGLCGLITLSGFPWYASDTAGGAAGVSDTPSPATADVSGFVNGIQVLIGGQPSCGGTIPVVFSNGNPITAASSFTFNDVITGSGGCSVDGVLSSDTNEDTNAY
tara:strand:- start:4986 stop:5588 length:603 start_codon:yes stop_codon:yes gene_type:complete